MILVFFLYSCATILSPEKGPYSLDSSPGTAQVYDENENLLGTTPFDMKKVGNKVKAIVLKKDGYVDKRIAISRQPKNGLVFLDAILLCIPCVVDIPSGNLTDRKSVV